MVTPTDPDLEALEKLIRAMPPEQLARLLALPGIRAKLREIEEEPHHDAA